MIYIAPQVLEKHVERKNPSSLEIVGTRDPFEERKFPLERFKNLNDGIVIYSSFLEIEDFTIFFCQDDNWRHLILFKWIGILDSSLRNFQIYSVLGSLKLIEAHGGRVTFKISLSDEVIRPYYQNIFNQNGINEEPPQFVKLDSIL